MFMYLVLTFFAFGILLENVLVVITINHLGDRAVSRSPIINYHYYGYKTKLLIINVFSHEMNYKGVLKFS